jgi:N-acetylneuraminic acid mutarotase
MKIICGVKELKREISVTLMKRKIFENLILLIVFSLILTVSAKQMIWISGSDTINQDGYYGEIHVTTPKNAPPYRGYPASWIDSSNNLYLFGGNRFYVGLHNDLWKFDGKNWTWIAGCKERDCKGSYGTKGVADPANFPGARTAAFSCIDSSYNVYLFGGYGYGIQIDYGYLNDLWKFDGANWTWISGSDREDRKGNYGQKGIPAESNMPGARGGAFLWTDSSNNLYLFGGDGYGSSGARGLLNDLWKFDGANWTWISGSNSRNQPGNYGQKGIPAESNMPGARGGAFLWTDSSNNLYLFGGFGYGPSSQFGMIGELNDLWKFDGANWAWISGSNSRNQPGVYGDKGVPDSENAPGARSYFAAWVDSLDNLYIFGGWGYATSTTEGWLNDLWKFNGEVWIWISGSNVINEKGVYGTKGVPDPNNVPGARCNIASWIDSENNLYLFGGEGYSKK